VFSLSLSHALCVCVCQSVFLLCTSFH
jgi:hypothetical protein